MAHKRAKRSIREADRQRNHPDRAPTTNNDSGGGDLDKMPKNAMRVLMSAQVREDYRKRKREEQEGGPRPSAEGGGKKGKGNTDGKKPATTTTTTPSTSSSSSKLTILPGESLLHFNRRVEDSLRSSVSAASKTAHAHTTEVMRLEREERTKKHDERVKKQTDAKAARDAKKAREEAGEGSEEEGSGSEEDSEEKKKPTKAKKAVPPKVAPPTAQETKDKKNKKLLQEFLPATSSSAPKRLNDIAMAPPTLTLPRFATKAIKTNAKAAEAGGTAGAAAARMGLSLAQQRILEEERERVILRYRELKERKGLKGEMFGGGALVQEE